MSMHSTRSNEVAPPREQEAVHTRRLPPYHVILENDDYHSIDFVVEVLIKSFGYPMQKSALLTIEAHRKGRAIVWTGSKELGELKIEQVSCMHEIRPDGKQLGPVQVYLEPAPQ